MSEILSKLFEKTLKSCEVPDSLSQDTCFSERYVFVTLIGKLLHSSTPKTKVFWNLWQESSANAAIVWGGLHPLIFHYLYCNCKCQGSSAKNIEKLC